MASVTFTDSVLYYVVKIIFMWKTIQTIFAMGLGLQQLDCVSLNFEEVEH